jgi:hypothetical protein
MFRYVMRLVFLAAAAATTIAFTETCPRPRDKQGRALYETLTGTFQSRSLSQFGGKAITILPVNGASPISITVTDKMYDAAESITPGTRINLLAYYRNAMSGARPGYTCLEIAQVQS